MRVGLVDVLMVHGKTHSGKGCFSELLEKKLKEDTTKNIIRCSLSTFVRKLAKEDFFYEGDMDSPECRNFMAKVYEYGTKLYPYHKARRMWERDVVPLLDWRKQNIVIVESFREQNDIVYFEMLRNDMYINNISTLKIERPNFEMKNYVVASHISENDLDNYNFQYHILNDGNINDLNVKVDNFIKEVGM